MILAAMYLLPPLAVSVLSRGRLRIHADRRSLLAAAAAVACLGLSGAGIVRHPAPVIAAFALGTGALGQVVWLSSGRRWVAALAAGGAGANLAAVASRGAMPVGADARTVITPEHVVEPGLLATKHIEVVHPAGLDWLGDVIPVAPLDAVVSVGDVLIVAAFVLTGCLGCPRPARGAGRWSH